MNKRRFILFGSSLILLPHIVIAANQESKLNVLSDTAASVYSGGFLYIISKLIIGAVLLIGIFLLIRYLILWYWKIDEIVKLLKQIESNTRKSAFKDVVESISNKKEDCI